jgi:uncharacterized protein involved in exopolysaccharide biosynthesis
MGELPEQMNANLATLSVLQKQLEVISSNLTDLRGRRDLFQQKIEMEAAGVPILQPSGESHLETLKRQLAELKTRFLDTHPDIIRLKQQITFLEEESKKNGENIQSPPVDTPPALRRSVLRPEQIAIETAITNATAELVKVQQDITLYKQRIENTPKREQEFTSLSRDYQSTRELYASLLKRLDEAKLADSLEQRQKAERFRLLEPAVYPQEPAAPKRARLLLIGCIASLALAASAMLLWEILDPSLHRREDLQALTNAPILGTVPRIVTKMDRLQSHRRRAAGAVILATTLLALAQGLHWVAMDNERLVRILVRPSSAQL